MKIFSASQIRDADAFTIQNEPISSIDLMERASQKFVETLHTFQPNCNEFAIFCGNGNNGGDGLAIARILTKRHKKVTVYHIKTGLHESKDYIYNLERLQACITPISNLEIKEITKANDFEISSNAIIIDSLFGSGLNKPITGITKDCIIKINSLSNFKIAVDIPSGLYPDTPNSKEDTILHVHQTYTFQYPKFSFLFAENELFIGDLQILDIGLSKEFENSTTSPFELITKHNITLHSRLTFSHKGTYGHALIIAGSLGKIGAAILTSRSCITSGCGLVTTHIPKHANVILQTAVPEVMTSIDTNETIITSFLDSKPYDAIGIGPGLGIAEETIDAFLLFLKNNTKPLVIDADGLNIIALHKDLLGLLPKNTILTPHSGEFDRLTRKHTTGHERLQTQIQLSKETHCIIVLKGKHTSISFPDGTVCFNSSGNPGMATAGSGDVLTGIILSLLAQKYSPQEAANYGVFIHGMAGDYALLHESFETLTAQKIIDNLRMAFRDLYTNHTK